MSVKLNPHAVRFNEPPKWNVFCIFFKKNWWTYVHFWSNCYSYFWLLVTSPLGLKARVGKLIRIFPWDWPLVYMASIVAVRFPHMRVSAEVGCVILCLYFSFFISRQTYLNKYILKNTNTTNSTWQFFSYPTWVGDFLLMKNDNKTSFLLP